MLELVGALLVCREGLRHLGSVKVQGPDSCRALLHGLQKPCQKPPWNGRWVVGPPVGLLLVVGVEAVVLQEEPWGVAAVQVYCQEEVVVPAQAVLAVREKVLVPGLVQGLVLHQPQEHQALEKVLLQLEGHQPSEHLRTRCSQPFHLYLYPSLRTYQQCGLLQLVLVLHSSGILAPIQQVVVTTQVLQKVVPTQVLCACHVHELQPASA